MEPDHGFLGHNSPLITCMVQGERAESIGRLIRKGIADGADAFGVQMEGILPEERTEENLRALVASAEGRPIYATNYRWWRNEGKSEEALAQGLLFLRRCGADLIDVPGDLYAPDPAQLTRDASAIEKQKALIRELHGMGAQVLMSSHIAAARTAEEILLIAREHAARGADISKIVTLADSDDEELELLRASKLLKRELGIPFLLLCGGKQYRLLRMIGPMLGSCMWLTVAEYDAFATPMQPLCRAIRALADHFPEKRES